MYYRIENSGVANEKGAIQRLNPKYRITEEEALENGFKLNKKWGSNLVSNITTYSYNGVTYTKCEKTTNNAEGTVSYALSGGNAEPKATVVTVAINELPGITRTREYRESDAVARMFRGYTGGGTGQGVGPVPYLLPIGTTTLTSSSVLSNDGYGFSSTYTADDVPVAFGSISTEYK